MRRSVTNRIHHPGALAARSIAQFAAGMRFCFNMCIAAGLASNGVLVVFHEFSRGLKFSSVSIAMRLLRLPVLRNLAKFLCENELDISFSFGKKSKRSGNTRRDRD